MGRLLSIDYGRKRCGVAVTDELQIVATGLDTVATHLLMDYLKKYLADHQIDKIILGKPTTMRGEESESMRYIRPFVQRLSREIPDIPCEFFDERFTSTLAHRAMIDGGMKKMDRRDKATVDRMAATIILNDYLNSRR